MSKTDRPNASKPTDTVRRTFLGATLAAPALVMAAPAAPDAAVAPPDGGRAEGRGYHTTDHIRTYYRLARF